MELFLCEQRRNFYSGRVVSKPKAESEKMGRTVAGTFTGELCQVDVTSVLSSFMVRAKPH